MKIDNYSIVSSVEKLPYGSLILLPKKDHFAII